MRISKRADPAERLRGLVLLHRQTRVAEAANRVAALQQAAARPDQGFVSPERLRLNLVNRPSAAEQDQRHQIALVAAQDEVRQALVVLHAVEDLIKGKRHGPC